MARRLVSLSVCLTWLAWCRFQRQKQITLDYIYLPQRYKRLCSLAAQWVLRHILRVVYDIQPGLQATESCLYLFHPHGALPLAPWAASAENILNKPPHHRAPFIAGASVIFYIPFVRSLALWADIRDITREFVRKALRYASQGVGVYPGGMYEQVRTDPRQEQAFLQRNLGVIRLAIQEGRPLCPVYSFGENQVFNIPSWSHPISLALYNATGWPVPIALPWPFWSSQPTTVYVRRGALVDTGPQCANPSDEHVLRVVRAYVKELQDLFAKHASTLLPPEVASRGLKIIWRGGKLEDVEGKKVSADPVAISKL